MLYTAESTRAKSLKTALVTQKSLPSLISGYLLVWLQLCRQVLVYRSIYCVAVQLTVMLGVGLGGGVKHESFLAI